MIKIRLLSPAVLVASSLLAQPQKPNVIFIAIDDLRDFVGYMGTNPVIKTPNIDRLAARGIAFTNAHVQAPFSAPSRNSLLTGTLPSSTGAYGFQPYDSVKAFRNIVNLPQHFRENNYYVAGAGKIFHSSDTKILDKSFDVYFEKPHYYITNTVEKVTNAKEAFSVEGNFKWGPSDMPDSLLEEVQRTDFIINELKKRHQLPFFLGIGYYKPHLPFIAPRRFFDMYPLTSIQPIDIAIEDLSDIPNAGKSFIYYKDEINIHKKQYQKQILQSYYACISYVDDQIGRLLDALDESRYAQNTIIVLWSDNGWHFGEKRTWRKFTLWQESTRVPFIISPVGGMKGVKCVQPVQLLDIYPTLMTMCGIPGPMHTLEGHDLSVLIKNPEHLWSFPALTTNGRNSHAITTVEWKYIRYFDNSEELYNIKRDPHCWTNLSSDLKYQTLKDSFQTFLPKVNVHNERGCEMEYWKTDYPNVNNKISRIQEAEKKENIKLLY